MKRAGTREKSEGASSPLSPSPARFVFAFRPHYLRAIRYRILLASKKTIGSFINVDGDSEENVKKAIDQNNNPGRALHFLVHFFAVTARLIRKNFLMARFMEDINTRR